jgi:peptidoglycan/LPS O-acetylase OafA/YrhL
MPESLSQWAEWVWSLGIAIHLVLIVILAAYVFRAIPIFPNKLLWLLCAIVGMIAFPFMAHPREDDTEWSFLIRTGLVGLFLGMGASTCHDRILSKNGWGLEEKIPGFRAIIDFIDTIGTRSHYRNRRKHHRHPNR